MREESPNALLWLQRFAIYGNCGIAAEVIFTAAWDAIENGNKKLIGVSSIHVFFVYGCAIMLIEQLSLLLRERNVGWIVRGAVYVLVIYSLEFALGWLLKQMDACPWDYSTYFKNHFMGLITPNYIPIWFLASLASERFVIQSALSLGWCPPQHIKAS